MSQDIQEGQTATNPQTGERVVFQRGRWVPISAAGGRTVVVGPADPARAANARKANVSADIDEATKGALIRKANAEADAEELKLATAQREAAMQTSVDPDVAKSIKGLGLDELLLSIQAARREIGTGRATGVTGALLRMFPGTTANDLSGSINSIQGATIMEKLQALKDASKTGASGMGALSEREGARLADSIAALNTGLSDAKLSESLATIERHALALKAVAAGKNPDDPEVAKEFGIVVDAPVNSPAKPRAAEAESVLPMALSKKGTTTSRDPALAGANAHLRGMIRQQRPLAEINGYLESLRPGFSQEVKNIPQWLAFAAKHPDKPIAVNIEEAEVPLTPAGSLLNSAAQSPVGAAIIGAADLLSGGTLDNMSSNPALTRAGLAGVAAEHPYATLAGQVGGAALAGTGVQGGLTKLGASGLTAMLAGDAIPAAAYGAGTTDDGSSRLGGAAGGGVTGIVGGTLGRSLGRFISGAGNKAVTVLDRAGVRLTPGQMLGGVPKRIEDGLTSMPLLGDLVRSQRTRGIDDFNRAAFREALEPIGAATNGQIGESAVANAEDAIGQAYRSALGGVRIQPDAKFINSGRAAMQAGSSVARTGPEFQSFMEKRIGPVFGNSGEIDGSQLQDVLQGLRAADFGDDSMGRLAREAVGDFEGSLTDLVGRQAPEVMPAFNAANKSYGRFATLQDAVLAGKNSGGRFTPAQLNGASVNGTKKFAGRSAAARGDRPFFELGRAGQEVLPSTLPDSGTASRLMIPGALATLGGGAGYASGGDAESAGTGALGALTLGGALASPYLTRAVLQRILAGERPRAVQTLGNVVGAARLPGALALPLLSEGP